MSIEHVQSTPVSNAYAVPAVANTTGEGAPGYLREVTGYLTIPASASADSTLRFVRVPSNAKVKSVRLTTEAGGGSAAIDIGVYYPVDSVHTDVVGSAIDQDFFASAVVISSAVPMTEVVNEAGGANASYLISEFDTPLWQALGLTVDPGGELDIVGTLTVAISSAAKLAAVSVAFVV